MRFVYSAPNATVFYDFDYEEFVVQFYRNGVLIPDADYFTDDQADAVDTACNFEGAPA
jgi:predicted metalloendopeptidase